MATKKKAAKTAKKSSPVKRATPAKKAPAKSVKSGKSAKPAAKKRLYLEIKKTQPVKQPRQVLNRLVLAVRNQSLPKRPLLLNPLNKKT
ncbi:MAG TPA: hypothetical protein VM012_02805 [Flavitalea sp.]|nr:hypothetical protein [Flavitalea sp.]